MFRVYEVLEDDTLDSIAHMYNTTINNLKEINGFNGISSGDMIVVPNDNKWYKKYIVKKGDNMYQIANMNNISVSELMYINGLDNDDYIYPEQEIIIPKDNYNIYITKENDNLKNIIDFLDGDIDELVKQSKNINLLEDQLIIYKK